MQDSLGCEIQSAIEARRIPILTKFAVYDKLSWMSQAMFHQKNVTLALALFRNHLGDRCQVMQSRIFPDACVVGVSGCAH
jgi:hypothetical protein